LNGGALINIEYNQYVANLFDLLFPQILAVPRDKDTHYFSDERVAIAHGRNDINHNPVQRLLAFSVLCAVAHTGRKHATLE
jgi:hypothetical protein